LLGEADEHQYFAIDKSLFGHKHNKQLWLLGFVNTATKQFRVEATYEGDANTIKKFIIKHVDKGNFIITDGWSAYNFLENPDSGYVHIKHNQGRGVLDSV
jgi:hypothetical protein